MSIVGWLATEIEYPCRENSTRCDDLNPQKRYHRLMPTSELDRSSAGWSCGQRRPLRALAHALQLFDPGFVVLVDDDTFVNMKFLLPGGLMHKYVHGYMAPRNLVIGEMYQSQEVSNVGYFTGGAGYLMSRGFLQNVTSNHLAGPWNDSDSLRSPTHMQLLSVLRLASAMAARSCPSCVKLQDNESECQEVGSQGTLAVRIVDVCANVLSGEKTCYHSNHAISRCVLHATYSEVVSADCNLSVLPGLPDHKIGMCQTPEKCDPDIHLTCHKYIPNAFDYQSPEPMRIEKK